jgi:hypothetical protein
LFAFPLQATSSNHRAFEAGGGVFVPQEVRDAADVQAALDVAFSRPSDHAESGRLLLRKFCGRRWSATTPVTYNSIEGDRSLMITTREPLPDGMLFRSLEIPPDPQDKANHVAQLTKLSQEIKQTVMPNEADLKRHPSMHRTNTLDVITCVMVDAVPKAGASH